MNVATEPDNEEKDVILSEAAMRTTHRKVAYSLCIAMGRMEVLHQQAGKVLSDLYDIQTWADEAAHLEVGREVTETELEAMLHRFDKVLDAQTIGLLNRKDAGDQSAEKTLRTFGLRILEHGFTIAEEGGVDVSSIEQAIASAFGLPGKNNDDSSNG